MRRRDRLALQRLADLAPASRTLAGRLGIKTEVRRVAVLNGAYKNVPSWDEENEVYSFNHLYRASVTLAKVDI